MGMGALYGASHISDPAFFKQHPLVEVAAEPQLLQATPVTSTGKHIEGIVRMYERIALQVVTTVRSGHYPLLISGDHSNAGGTLAGLRLAYPDKRIGAIWIDAHADLHSVYTSPSGNVHGMPLATAIFEDNLECQVNTPEPAAVEAWNALKGDRPRIRPEDVVFIALRDTEAPEGYLVEKYNMGVHLTADVRSQGAQAIAEACMARLADCDLIYISFDVDSMDPMVSVGTGTPVPDGLTAEEAEALLTYFAAQPKVGCMEFTEINPLLDKDANAMGRTAFALLQKTVVVLEKR